MALRVYLIDNGIFEYMVAAKNQKEAARLLGCTTGILRDRGSIANERERAVALSEPGRVWKKRMDFMPPQPWVYEKE